MQVAKDTDKDKGTGFVQKIISWLLIIFQTFFSGMCLFKNQYYREKQVWYDGCNAICTCEDGNTGFYRCQSR